MDAKNAQDPERIRIRFSLTPDEEGWPPSTGETLWGQLVERDCAIIDNVPLYVMNIAVGDLVRFSDARSLSEPAEFQQVLTDSGRGTVRVMIFADGGPTSTNPAPLWRELLELGCSFEGFSGTNLFAIDVPADVDYPSLHVVLERGIRSGLWDYDVGKLPRSASSWDSLSIG